MCVCLYVCVKAFEDLDEIIARYIQPMAAYTRDLLSYKCHVDSDGGRPEILDRLLIDDKRKQPSRSTTITTTTTTTTTTTATYIIVMARKIVQAVVKAIGERANFGPYNSKIA